ncbi:MAG: hypothetical protein KJ583_01260 [Nanoarchaeota archaeon]|nr:hypothetical protein [Nanoarchaeota archaeon]MBU1269458.1 hypothetical protein [Nanoarchaeota archaeon]MBU1603920.1 hypothetical protein [Nanoarchaeota archaeon]MBU2443482.1 hypothetical protein [Nanoarchaeota archaeon]
MNHLITYGFHKSGHYYLAKAIEQELISRDESVEIKEFYSPLGDLINKFFFEIFLEFENKKITKVPEVIIKEKTLKLMSEIGVEKNKIDFSAYDSVISTHQHTTKIIAELKRVNKYSFYLSDSNCNYDEFPLIQDIDINAYFGARPLAEVSKSVFSRMHNIGIPISPRFKYNSERKEDLIVVVGGTHGMGGIEDSVLNIKKAKHNYKVVVVTGNNQILREKLSSTINDSRFEITGFVDDLSELYNRSKVVVTKGSGMSITEAITSGNILFFPKPNLFWEGIGADYIASKGAGIIFEGNKHDVERIERLLSHKEIYDWHRNNAMKIVNPNAGKELVDVILQQKIKPLDNLYFRVNELKNVFQRKENLFENSSNLSFSEKKLYSFIKSELNKYFKRMIS